MKIKPIQSPLALNGLLGAALIPTTLDDPFRHRLLLHTSRHITRHLEPSKQLTAGQRPLQPL
jgi:hypothetical protein